MTDHYVQECLHDVHYAGALMCLFFAFSRCYDAERKQDDRDRHPINQKEKHTLYPVSQYDLCLHFLCTFSMYFSTRVRISWDAG